MELLSESLEQLANLRAILETSEKSTSDNEKLIKLLKKKIHSFMKCQAEIEELNLKIRNIEKEENSTQPIEESADMYRKSVIKKACHKHADFISLMGTSDHGENI